MGMAGLRGDSSFQLRILPVRISFNTGIPINESRFVRLMTSAIASVATLKAFGNSFFRFMPAVSSGVSGRVVTASRVLSCSNRLIVSVSPENRGTMPASL